MSNSEPAAALQKFDSSLRRDYLQNPPSDSNSHQEVRFTAKVSDGGAELQQFLQSNGGAVSSRHGAILSCRVAYGRLLEAAALPSVICVQGNVKLFPVAK